MFEKNLYQVLELSWRSPESKVRESYRRLAKSLHPDLHPNNPQATEQFKEVAHAYWVLSDPERRKNYLLDHPRFDPPPTSRKTSAQPGFTSPRQKTNVKPDQADLHIRIHLTLEEYAVGIIKSIRIDRWEGCPACEGTGIAGGVKSVICTVCNGEGSVPNLTGIGLAMIPCRRCEGTGLQSLSACSMCIGKGRVIIPQTIEVKIPAGHPENEAIILKNQGQLDTMDCDRGDLKVSINLKDHHYFERQGKDLKYYCRISLLQWVEGCELKAPTLDGPVVLKIPPLSKPSGILKVRGRGLPQKAADPGNLFVHYTLHLPDGLTKKQFNLLRKLHETPGFAPQTDDQGFFPRKA
jgi:molecular chaperone DnaJ